MYDDIKDKLIKDAYESLRSKNEPISEQQKKMLTAILNDKMNETEQKNEEITREYEGLYHSWVTMDLWIFICSLISVILITIDWDL